MDKKRDEHKMNLLVTE